MGKEESNANVRIKVNLLQGEVAPGFVDVASEFEKNFAERKEVGAACAVYTTKGSRSWICGAATGTAKPLPLGRKIPWCSSSPPRRASPPLPSHWPEFAQNGKENITVRQLLGHQAGLCAIDEPLNTRVLADLDGVAEILARQRPAWEPGTRHGYHYLSLGLYEGELIRRTDPKHRSLGRFFQEEIAALLDLGFYIGLPPSVPDSKVATIEGFHPLQMLLHMNIMPVGMVLGYLNPWSLTRRTFGNPKLRSPTDFNRPETDA